MKRKRPKLKVSSPFENLKTERGYRSAVTEELEKNDRKIIRGISRETNDSVMYFQEERNQRNLESKMTMVRK